MKSNKPSQGRTAPKPSRRPRGTKEATRNDLIDATIHLVRKGGVAAVSSVSVTEKAGLAQSGFYQHFDNVDDCLKAAADRVATRVRQFIADDRRRIQQEADGELESQVGHYQAILSLFYEERGFAEVLLRNRYDKSPLGRRMAKLLKEIRDDLIADLWQIARALGIHDEHFDQVVLLASFIQANVLAAWELILDGRVTDRELIARELAAVTAAAAQDMAVRCSSTEG